MVSKDDENIVQSLVIDDDGKYECGTDHSLLVLKVSTSLHKKITWRYNDILRFNIKDDTDYTMFKSEMSSALQNTEWREYRAMTSTCRMNHLAKTFTNVGQKVFGYKVPKIKKKSIKLPKQIVMALKSKRELEKELKVMSSQENASQAHANKITQLKEIIKGRQTDIND